MAVHHAGAAEETARVGLRHSRGEPSCAGGCRDGRAGLRRAPPTAAAISVGRCGTVRRAAFCHGFAGLRRHLSVNSLRRIGKPDSVAERDGLGPWISLGEVGPESSSENTVARAARSDGARNHAIT